MVAMMTGVPALGKIGQQDHVRRRRVDRSDPARAIADARRPDPDEQDAVRVAAAGRRRALRPRRGRAARAVVPGRRSAGRRDISPAPAADVPGDAAAQRLQPRLRRQRCRPGPTRSRSWRRSCRVLDFMRSDLARMQTLIPSSEKDRLAAHADRHPAARGEPPADVRHDDRTPPSARSRRCRPTYANTSTGKQRWGPTRTRACSRRTPASTTT